MAGWVSCCPRSRFAGPARLRRRTITAALLVEREQNMKKTVLALALLLTLGGVQAFGGADDQVGARRTAAGTVTRLLTRDLPDVPGKEGMIEIVDFALARPPRCIDMTPISSCTCWKEAS